MPFEDLVLMPEVAARRVLAQHPLKFSLLAPLGTVAGRGVLRVLRLRSLESAIELVCGYEAYEGIGA